MTRKDLDVGLLLKIMARLEDVRDQYPLLLGTTSLLDLVPPGNEQMYPQGQLSYLVRHVLFLRDEGYLRPKDDSPYPDGWLLQLTTKGEKFVQPELAEFGLGPLLPDVVKSLEEKVQVLTYPQEEKDSLLYRLREAVAKQVPDVIAKVIAEVGFKIATGGA